VKFFLILSLMISFAFAEDKKAAKFEEIKPKILAHIDQRIDLLQKHKSCVQSASSKEQMKACRDSHKDLMKKIREDRREENRKAKSN
jgi:hypothetical protein